MPRNTQMEASQSLEIANVILTDQERKEGGSRELRVVQLELHLQKHYDTNPSQCHDKAKIGQEDGQEYQHHHLV